MIRKYIVVLNPPNADAGERFIQIRPVRAIGDDGTIESIETASREMMLKGSPLIISREDPLLDESLRDKESLSLGACVLTLDGKQEEEICRRRKDAYGTYSSRYEVTLEWLRDQKMLHPLNEEGVSCLIKPKDPIHSSRKIAVQREVPIPNNYICDPRACIYAQGDEGVAGPLEVRGDILIVPSHRKGPETLTYGYAAPDVDIIETDHPYVSLFVPKDGADRCEISVTGVDRIS